MLPKAHLTSHSRMSGSRWVITPLWLSGSWRSFLYNSSVYSCHLFLISSASVRSIPFLSFIEPIFALNVPLVSLIFLNRCLVFPILLFSSISFSWGWSWSLSPVQCHEPLLKAIRRQNCFLFWWPQPFILRPSIDWMRFTNIMEGDLIYSTSTDLNVVCCMLSHFSLVQLFVTLWTVAHQAPLSMGFSRQECWRGCHSLLQGIIPITTSKKNPSTATCEQMLDQTTGPHSLVRLMHKINNRTAL